VRIQRFKQVLELGAEGLGFLGVENVEPGVEAVAAGGHGLGGGEGAVRGTPLART
jgi:hypothetical protein